LLALALVGGCERRTEAPPITNVAPVAPVAPPLVTAPAPSAAHDPAQFNAALEAAISAAHAQTQRRMDEGETFGGSEGVPCVDAIVTARRAAAGAVERALRAGLAAPADASGAAVACQASRELTAAFAVLSNGASQAINVDGPGSENRAHCDEPAVSLPAELSAIASRLAARCP
jgi:hypothetical protein